MGISVPYECARNQSLAFRIPWTQVMVNIKSPLSSDKTKQLGPGQCFSMQLFHSVLTTPFRPVMLLYISMVSMYEACHSPNLNLELAMTKQILYLLQPIGSCTWVWAVKINNLLCTPCCGVKGPPLQSTDQGGRRGDQHRRYISPW